MTFHAGENQLAGSSEAINYSLALTIPNFEYSQLLPNNCRKFSIKPRSKINSIKLAYTSGESGINYITIDPSGYWEDIVGLSQNKTLYLQCEAAGNVAEIVAWS